MHAIIRQGEGKYYVSAEYDHFWLGSTVILQDGFVYLIDDDDMTVDKIGPGYCYFKARHMKYRIIPD
jgi:hypothetical protein